MRNGPVSSRVALLLRSAEGKPSFASISPVKGSVMLRGFAGVSGGLTSGFRALDLSFFYFILLFFTSSFSLLSFVVASTDGQKTDLESSSAGSLKFQTLLNFVRKS